MPADSFHQHGRFFDDEGDYGQTGEVLWDFQEMMFGLRPYI